jgi:hypothetical protein
MKIFEIESQLDRSEIVKFATQVMTNCGPYLRAINYNLSKYPLYRGVKGNIIRPTIILCPINRAPRDTMGKVHEIADSYFLDKFGVRYRSNAVFCTGSPGIATDYGELTVLIPISNFKFCWSPEIEDFTSDINDELYFTKGEKVDFAGQTHWVNDPGNIRFTETVNKMLAKGKYRDNEFLSAVRSHHEIMVHATQFYLMPADILTALSKIIKFNAIARGKLL